MKLHEALIISFQYPTLRNLSSSLRFTQEVFSHYPPDYDSVQLRKLLQNDRLRSTDSTVSMLFLGPFSPLFIVSCIAWPKEFYWRKEENTKYSTLYCNQTELIACFFFVSLLPS